MGNFRSDNRGGFGGRSRGSGGYGGRSSGGRSFGGRDRDSGGFGGRDRRPLEMHEVICAKCGKETEVPFKPTGDKPVYCRDCFDKNGGDRGSNRSFNAGGASAGAGMSQEQFKQINEKLDKIIAFLETIEIEEDEEGLEDEEESEEGAVEETK
jgi:CxxC-x17-CxxC domain-containing protein